MKKLKVALIGAGQIARVSHIVNYQSFEDVEVVAICDANSEAAKETAGQFSIPAYFDNHITMLESVDIDAVSVCVPNAFHGKITCDALEGGCHVYCEKPPAITVEEAVRMEEAAREAGKLLTFGFHFRHGENISLMKRKVKKGEFGHIYGANVEWVRRRGIPGWGNFTSKALQGGGPLIDLGAHMLDLVCYLLDYPKVDYVCATASDLIGKRGGTGFMGTWPGESYTVEDGLFGFIKMENGTSIQLQTAFALNIKEKDIRKVMLYGEHMGASLFPPESYGEEEGLMVNREYPFVPEADLHKAALYNFVEGCLGKQEILVTPKQAVYIQRILCACYESASTGRPVILTGGNCK